MKPKIIKTTVCSALLLFLSTGFLVGCAGGFLSSSSSTSPSSNNALQGPPPAGARQIMTGISGVITQYNASQKMLTIRTSTGTTRIFTTGQATIEKSQSITTQTLKSLLTNNKNMVRFTGQKSNNTTYTAQEVTVMAMNASNGQNANGPSGNGPSSSGNPPTNSGTPPVGGTGSMPSGTPPASNGPGNGAPPSGTPPAGNGGVMPSGTPPTGSGGATNATPPASNGNTPAGNDQAITLQNVKMQNNQLFATTFSGQSIIVNLGSSTKVVQQVPATTSDLKAGLQVTIMQAPTTQSGSINPSARIVIIETVLK